MAKWGSALKKIFGGGGRETRIAEINNQNMQAQAQEQQRIATERQQSQLNAERAVQETDIARARKVPRGRRLLMAATGEEGVKGTIG